MKHVKTYLLIICFSINLLYASAQVAPINTENVRFPSKWINLIGTIYYPKHPVAALIIVHGSGQERRMSGYAETLANNGFCVLTYDKRGIGESEGIYAGPEVCTNNIDSSI